MSRIRRVLPILIAFLIGILLLPASSVRAQNAPPAHSCVANTQLPWGFQMWQDQRGWMGIAVSPQLPHEFDVYLEVLQGNTMADTTAYSPRVLSTISGETNFLVKDFSTEPDQWLFAKAWTYPEQSLGYVVEWDSGQGALPIDTPQSFGYGGISFDCGLIRVFKVALDAGQRYHFYLTREHEDEDVRMALLWSGSQLDGWANRGDALFEKAADTPTSAVPYTFTAGHTGNYALVVFMNDMTVGGGDYTVSFEEYNPPVNAPDLVVRSIDPDYVSYGSSVTATIHLYNQGEAAAPSCVTQVSLDGAVSCASVATPAIGVGEWATVTCNLGTPSAGTHTITAAVDFGNEIDEEDEANNTLSETLWVQSTGGPDLVIAEVGPTTVVPNQPFQVNVVVRNDGNATAGATTTDYSIDSGLFDLQLPTPSLAPGDTARLSGTISGLSEGLHDVVAVADYDDVVNESNEFNNGAPFTIQAEGPNLVIDSITPTQVYGEGAPDFQIVVHNTGNGSSDYSYTRLQVDGVSECSAIYTPALASGATVTVECPGSTLDPGEHTVTAYADVTHIVLESNENDNTRTIVTEMIPTSVTVYADGSGYYATIQEAIDDMPAGSEILLVGGEVYSGPGNRDLDFHGKNLTVIGALGGGAIIDCGGNPEEAHRAFTFHSGEGRDAVVSNLIITNGWNEYGTGGGIFIGNAEPTIEKTVIHHCHADVGGAIGFSSDYDSYHPLIQECTLTKNSANSGDAVYLAKDSAPDFNRCLIVSNYGTTGAIVCNTDLGTPHPSFSCTDIWGNGGGDWVGCVSSLLGVDGNISKNPLFCDFANDVYTLASNSPCSSDVNASCGRIGVYDAECGPMGGTIRSVKADGSGEYLTIQQAINASVDGDIVELDDGTYTGTGNYEINPLGRKIIIRSASGDPHACLVDGQDTYQLFRFVNGETPETTVEGIGIVNGAAANGAGIYCEASSPTLMNLYVAGNDATEDGGGLFCTDHASPIVENCTFDKNSAYDDGGGLYAYDWSSPIVRGCSFIYNQATDRGGGALFVVNSFPELDDCEFRENAAANGGGLIFVYAYGPVRHCQFHENTADYGGAIQCYGNAQVSFTNCTMNGNEAAQGACLYLRGNSSPTIEACILSFGQEGAAIDRYSDDCNPTLSCTDIYGNTLGDWTAIISDQFELRGNFSENPLFCDAGNGDLTLRGDSPCAMANNVECGQVGALPVGCLGSWLVRADGSGDFATIQEAIDAAVDGESVVLADGTFTGDGNRDLDFKGKEITIHSQSGNAKYCIIDCQADADHPHRGFFFGSGETANSVLKNVTIRNAWSTYGGGMRIDSANPTIQGVIFDGNGGGDGGAIILANASPVIEDCIFEDNEVTDAGGAIYANASYPQISGCVFKGNSAHWGGGALYNQHAGPNLIDCRFENNHSNYWGGAVHSRYSESNPHFNNCLFVGNNAPYGGVAYGREESYPTFTDCTFSGNYSSNGAVAHLVSSALINLTRSIAVFSTDGSAVTTDGTGTAYVFCSDVYGNAGGDWVDGLDGLLAGSDNFSANPSFCDLHSGDYSLASNSPCLASRSPCGLQVGAFDLGCVLTDVPDTPQLAVDHLVLEAAVPNPFNPRTTIAFTLPRAGAVDLNIYSADGRRVKLLVHESLGAGRHEVIWTGTDDQGSSVASGVYLVKLRAGGEVKVGKLALIR